MSGLVEYQRRHDRYRRAAILLVLLVVLPGVVWAVGRKNALPPRSIVMATGPAGGSYEALARRYQEALARLGLKVELRSTQGDVENLALLRDPRSGVSAAFLQSGTTTEAESPGLASLGATSIQPVWIFFRGAAPARNLPDLIGRTVSAGTELSGTRAVVTRIFRTIGVDPAAVRLVGLPPAAAADALKAGEIDGMILVSSWDSPVVRRMVGDPSIEVGSVARADAIVALDPSLEKQILPMGVGDMLLNRPPRDVTLLALRVSLVVPRELHSAVQYLLLDAASEVHGGGGLFHRAGQFPAAAGIDLPLSVDARHFYKSGRPFLQRYLPYWIAVLVERLLLVLIPVVGLLVPFLRVLPEVYRGVMERRIIRLYGELKLLEAEMEAMDADQAGALMGRLDDLEARTDRARIPPRFSLMRYTLKQHIDLVRHRMRERASGGGRPVR